MELVLDPEKREVMNAKWEELFKEKLFASERTFFASVHDENCKCMCVDQGLWLWKSIAESTFGNHFRPCKSLFNLRRSSIWTQGFQILDRIASPSECESIEKLIFPEGANEGKADEGEIKRFETLSLVARFLASWENQYLPKGYSIMPWKIGAYATNKTTTSLSDRWHYDLDMAENVIFFMINLNGSNDENFGGTYFLSNPDSILLSAQSGYISTPLAFRSKSLKEINWTGCNLNPVFSPSRRGRVLAFMPSRSLHKGGFGNTYWRKNLHISASISPSDSGISRTCIPNRIQQPTTIERLSMSDRVLISANPIMDKTGKSPYLMQRMA